jgi:hypothetical protein
MSRSRLVPSLLLVVMSLMLCTSTAWAQQSQLREVPGARVTVRADTGWSYDLMLWREYVQNELGAYQFSRFVLQGWTTTPELDSFYLKLSMPASFLIDNHTGWTIGSDIPTGTHHSSGEHYNVGQWRGNRAKVTIGDQRASMVISLSDTFRSALLDIEGLEGSLNDVRHWYSIASILEGNWANQVPTFQQCRDAAREDCVRPCVTLNGTINWVCTRYVNYDFETGQCTYECQSVAECCGHAPLPFP